MKFALITLISVAAVLGIITYFALFSGPQIIQPNQTSPQATNTTSIGDTASTTATSSAFLGGTGNDENSNAGSSSPSSSSSSQQVYQTTFTAPYPIAWSEGEPQLGIMGATLQDDQLILSVNIQMGDTAQCVPVNLRLITDEQGDMAAPSAPVAPNFPLAADGTCQGDAETAYSESVTFTVDPTNTPWLFSTGDPANGFFEVATTTAGELQITVPQKNG